MTRKDVYPPSQAWTAPLKLVLYRRSEFEEEFLAFCLKTTP
jgi:hypothetical protein